MKSRETVLCAVLVSVLLFGVYHEFGGAAGGEVKLLPARVCVVSVHRVLTEGDKAKVWKMKIDVEVSKAEDDIKKLKDDFVADKAILKTRKPDSEDHDRLLRELMEKDMELQVKENFYSQYFIARQTKWEESSFRDVLEVIEKVAKEKGIDIVLAMEDYRWPLESAKEYAMVRQTSKVLYHATDLDITDAVLSAWNATK